MKHLSIALWIGAGGLLGTLARYLITVVIEQWFVLSFPLATFAVNIVGSFILGFLTELSLVTLDLRPELRMFLTTGFCGALTTFSTFMLDNYRLAKDNQIFMSLMYIGLSIFLGLVFFYLGILLARHFFSN